MQGKGSDSKLRPAKVKAKRGQLNERQEAISRRHCGGKGGGNHGAAGRMSRLGWTVGRRPEAAFYNQVMILGS